MRHDERWTTRKKDDERRISSYSWANAILSKMPPEALDHYRLIAEPKAKELIALGHDPKRLEEIYDHYRYTQTGQEAGAELAKHYLDRGRSDIAARLYAELLKRTDFPLDKTPENLASAAYAFVLEGKAKERDEVLRRLKDAIGNGPVPLPGGREITFAAFQDQMQRKRSGARDEISEEYLLRLIGDCFDVNPKRAEEARKEVAALGERPLAELTTALEQSKDPEDERRLLLLSAIYLPRWRTPRCAPLIPYGTLALSLSSDGKELLVANSRDDTTIARYDTATGSLARAKSLRFAGDRIALSPDGTLLAIDQLVASRETIVYNTGTGMIVARYPRFNGGAQTRDPYSKDNQLRFMTFLNDGKELCYLYMNGRIDVFDRKTGKVSRTFEKRVFQPIASSPASVSADKKTLVTVGREIGSEPQKGPYTIYIWDTATGTLEHSFPDNGLRYGHCLSPDGSLIAYRDNIDSPTKIWDRKSRKVIETLHTNARPVAFTTGNKKLVTSSPGGILRIWDLGGTGAPPVTLRGFGDQWPNEVLLSQDGKTLVAATINEPAKVCWWKLGNPETGKKLALRAGRKPAPAPVQALPPAPEATHDEKTH